MFLKVISFHIISVCFAGLLKGNMDVRIHNEAYTRVHLGFMGVNLDFFSCRICYKGGAHYAFNIMQVIHPSPLSTKYRLSMSVFGF